MGLPPVRPTPSMVKLQSHSGSGKGLNRVISAVTVWFTVASPNSCTDELQVNGFHHEKGMNYIIMNLYIYT